MMKMTNLEVKRYKQTEWAELLKTLSETRIEVAADNYATTGHRIPTKSKLEIVPTLTNKILTTMTTTWAVKRLTLARILIVTVWADRTVWADQTKWADRTKWADQTVWADRSVFRKGVT